MLVNTVYDLQNIKNGLAGTYVLGRDIDAGVTSGWNSGAGFELIAAGTSFTGILNGQGHTISGLFINRPGTQNTGLISYLATGATVSNVGVIGATVIGRTAVGAVVGSNYGTVTNVYSSGSVTATEAGAGGLVGYNYQTVSNGYSNSTVSGPLFVGGAIGLSNIGTVGGVNTTPSVSQVYATGAVNGTGGSPSYVGGLIGLNGGSVTTSYWDTYTSGQASGVGSGGSAGVTAVTSDPAQSAAANYAFKQSAYSNFSFPGTGATGWFMVDGQTRPFGRWEYQTTITNVHQLQLMAMDLGASYRLASDIDFSSGLAVGGRYPGMWSASGFSPIGSPIVAFTGGFDGQGRSISNLSINLPQATHVGLFGTIGIGGSASNLRLQNASITGDAHVGGLAGQNEGSISNVSVSGAIAGDTRIGGLVGQNNSSINDSSASGTVTVSGGGFSGGLVGVNLGSVSGSFATVAVSGNGQSVSFGGLVGWNNGSASIIQSSYATGTVSFSTTYTGGLVGRNDGKVFDSYATGNVSGGTQGTGGLVGYNTGSATIARTYAAGTVNASALVGGLVGSNDGSVAQSYWDTTTSGRSVGMGAGSTTGATGLTTSQMQNPASYATTYAGWDFANVWSPPSAGYYPQLFGVNYVLRVDPANASRAYGDANPAFTYTAYGLHTSDTSAILSGLSLSTAATTTSNVGSYAITAGGSIISTAGQAYRLIQTPAALTVTPRSITVTADAKSRAYGDINPALTYQVGGSGLANGDTLSGALATSATTASNVGVYGIAQGTLASPNYAISSFTGNNLTVDPARDHGDGAMPRAAPMATPTRR